MALGSLGTDEDPRWSHRYTNSAAHLSWSGEVDTYLYMSQQPCFLQTISGTSQGFCASAMTSANYGSTYILIQSEMGSSCGYEGQCQKEPYPSLRIKITITIWRTDLVWNEGLEIFILGQSYWHTRRASLRAQGINKGMLEMKAVHLIIIYTIWSQWLSLENRPGTVNTKNANVNLGWYK